MSTKAEIINGAYSKLRISGLTVSPSAEDVALALNELENMMEELFGNQSLNIGYVFEDDPQSSTPTGVNRQYRNMMETNLAVRLIAAFNKNPPSTLIAQASQSYSGAIGSLVLQSGRQVLPSRRMPRGSGNRFSNTFSSRYMQPPALPPDTGRTNRILVGETFDYTESFSAWLVENTISSYAIVADPRLTIVTSANADPDITFTITAVDNTAQGAWQQVKLTVTDSAGRVDIRIINFEVLDVPAVG